MTAQKEEINLLPQKGFESSTAGRVLAWILSSFRIIVIVTEIIVMVAFLSRFWLDAQNSDLSDEINQKQAVLVASLDFEKDFRDIQQRLSTYSKITSQPKFSDIFKSIVASIPEDIILDSINESGDAVIIKGTSPNEVAIQQFIVNMSPYKEIAEVILSQIKSSEDSTESLKFEINVTLSKKEAQI